MISLYAAKPMDVKGLGFWGSGPTSVIGMENEEYGNRP